MNDTVAIVLAAGKGTRMNSRQVKVLHALGGDPMIHWPVAAAKDAGASRVILVVGHQADAVRGVFAGREDIAFALQEEQLGTGHAVSCAARELRDYRGTVFILCGDVPLIRPETLRSMRENHSERNAVVSILTTHVDNPHGYGRVVKREGGRVLRIVEEKDATDEQKNITEINSGIYCADAEFLFRAVSGLRNDNAQGEYYLTDIVAAAMESGELCLAYQAEDPLEVLGINDRVQLAAAASEIRRRKNIRMMLDGVTMIDPATVYLEGNVEIGADTVISPNVHVGGTTVIGTGCILEPGVVIRNSRIGSNVVIKSGSVISDSVLHDDVAIGPMAHLRPGTELGAQVKIGNFVETKKIVMGEGSKASHLTYLGDAVIGKNVNIGCGTITCNYDGVNKHRTVIGDDVFVGSDVQFVAPVSVGRNALVAAGTTVTADVPPDSLAIARVPQVNKVGWRNRNKG
jgi:bifunctional UDP-N-acetylglucosamine pyrophosphorylase/glucosamine-1-phosphate N-acetyltransferase